MAGVKISVLPAGGALQSNDLMPIARGASTLSVRGSVIFPVTEPNMDTNSVSNRTLSANVVSLDKIRTMPGYRVLGNNTDAQGNVVAVQVNEGMIANDAVTSVKIKANEVKTVNILNNAVTLGKIEQVAANRVLGAAAAGNVTETQVLEDMIANDAVTSAKIKDGEVKNANIANGAVNRNKIATNEVMFTNLQQIGATTNSVVGYTTANTNAQALKIVNDMITNLTITGDKIATGFGLIPSGGIIMWSGSIANIPAGWALCNGSNGTPNLRNRFIVGAGSTYAVGDVGGANTVTLTVAQMPAHDHSGITGDDSPDHSHTSTFIRDRSSGATGNAVFGDENYYGTEYVTSGGASVRHTHSIDNQGGDQAHENRPPYYALAYIMKL